MSNELIRSYKAELVESGCHPGSGLYRASITMSEDISEVLPYLNAALEPPPDYRHQNRVLLWKNNNKVYAFRPNEISIAPVFDNSEIMDLANNIISTVNSIWNRRTEIVPSVKGKKSPPRVLDILKLLPKTNCEKCGFPTCMAFASQLISDFEKLSLCPYLSEHEFSKVVSYYEKDDVKSIV